MQHNKGKENQQKKRTRESSICFLFAEKICVGVHDIFDVGCMYIGEETGSFWAHLLRTYFMYID